MDSIRETPIITDLANAQILEGEIELDIDIKPYILYPHIPPQGSLKEEFAKKTKPGMGRSLKYEAKEENISINYRNIERIPYSFEAHRLAWLIDDRSLRFQISKQFFYDYFEQGQDLGNEEYLIQTAKSLGVHKETIGRFLDPQMGFEEVHQYIDNLRSEGVTLVPSIRFTPQIVLPSLQPIDVWINYIRRAARLQHAT